jgi:hypothetical protein
VLTPSPAGVNPAYSIQIRVRPDALAAVRAVIEASAGTVTCVDDRIDVTGARSVTLDTDSARTLARLRETLVARLGDDLLDAEDLAFLAASTGKLTQRVCASLTTGHDMALLDADADRRVVGHLAANPGEVDRYSGRARRVALVTDASAVLGLEPVSAEAALPAVESQAVHLRRATGLDVHPLPVAARTAQDLADAIRLVAPGFAAVVLVHTHISRTDAVRRALGDGTGPILLDSVNDGVAVAAAAATLAVLRERGIDPYRARVAVVDPGRAGELAGLLVGVGIADLTLYDPVTHGTGPLHDLAPHLDLVVDLIGLADPPAPVPVLHARPDAPPRLAAATTGPRPLHALPGLMTAAVAARRPITPAARLAAARTLLAHTRPGHALPSPAEPGLTAAVAAAATAALG